MKSDSNNCSKYSERYNNNNSNNKKTEIVSCAATVPNNNGALIYCPSVNNCNKMNSTK